MSVNGLTNITLTVSNVSPFDFSASFNSDAVDLTNIRSSGIQLTMAGGATAVGTISIQVSNDNTNWTTWTNSSYTINATTGSPFYWELDSCTGLYLRMVFTRTSGTGNGTAILIGKSY